MHGVGGVLIANGGNVGLGSAIPHKHLMVQWDCRIQAHGFIARNNGELIPVLVMECSLLLLIH